MGVNTTSRMNPKVVGFCDPKYEKVKKHLENMLVNGSDENFQLCVYVEGKCVIDLYGISDENSSYNANKTQNVYSSGKNIEAIIMAMLHDKGLFKYEDPVIKYWPKFGQNGKVGVKICDILRHECGLTSFSKPLGSFENAWTENIKLNKVGEFIEGEKQNFPESRDGINFKRYYHATSRGLLINELVRRIHPQGKTLGEVLRDEIIVKGSINLGLKDEEQINQVFPVKIMTEGYVLVQSLTPKWARKKLNFSFGDLINLSKVAKVLAPELAKQKPMFSEMGKNFWEFPKWVKYVNGETVGLKAECSSINIQANAKGLGELASWMANKGQGLMSEATWNEMHAEDSPDYDYMFYLSGQMRTRFTKGGVNFYRNLEDANDGEKEHLNKNRDGFYGWMGYGGSLFQWHPELKIGFAFVPSVLNIAEFCNERGAVLQQLVKDCATQ